MRDCRGVAIGALSTFRLLGGAVATAIYSSVVTNQFADRLPGQLQSQLAGTGFNVRDLAALAQAAVVGTEAVYAEVPGITERIIAASQLAVRLAYVEAFKVVYYTALGFAVLAIFSALLVPDTDPAKKTMQRAVILENESGGARDPKALESQENV